MSVEQISNFKNFLLSSIKSLSMAEFLLEKKRIDSQNNLCEDCKFEYVYCEGILICPVCGKKMQEKKMGQMSVDICEKCGGVFLERGKEKHLNELIGPYKSQALKAKDQSSRRRRR